MGFLKLFKPLKLGFAKNSYLKGLKTQTFKNINTHKIAMAENMENEELNNNIEEEEKKDRKGIIIILLALLFLVLGALAYFSSPALVAPKNVAAVVEGNNVILTWDPPDIEVEGYNIYRSTVKGELGEKINPEPVKETSYIDEGLEEGLYYYVVRSYLNGKEDDNLNQVEVYVGQSPEFVGEVRDFYTTNPRLEIPLPFENAEECRYALNSQWSEWFDWKESFTLTLPGEGSYKVSLQCRNPKGMSERITFNVVYDATPPKITASLKIVERGKVKVSLLATDNVELPLTCEFYADNVFIEKKEIPQGEEVSYTLPVPKQDFELEILCKDSTGNEERLSYPVVYKEGFELSLVINNGEETTTSRNVDLLVISEEARFCRFTNEENYPDYTTPWMPYREHYSWRLSEGEGEKTVYVECMNDEEIKQEAHDSIYYQEESSGGGAVLPEALGVKIIGYSLEEGQSNHSVNFSVMSIYRENDLVTVTPNVYVELSSLYATQGKLWNEPFYYNGQRVNVPDIVDSEDEAEWDPIYTNGRVAFTLIPKMSIEINDTYTNMSLFRVIVIPDGMRKVYFKVSDGEHVSSTISDTIFYDETPPVLVSLEGEAIVVNNSHGGGQVNYTPTASPRLVGVLLSIDAQDNGDAYGYGVKRMEIKKYQCEEASSINYSVSALQCTLVERIERDFSSTYLDTNVEAAKKYKYVVRVKDLAGYYSNAKQVIVEIPGLGSEESPVVVERFDVEETHVNEPRVVVHLSARNANYCQIVDEYEDNKYVMLSVNGNLYNGYVDLYDSYGTHELYAVCYNDAGQDKSDSVIVVYDNHPPVIQGNVEKEEENIVVTFSVEDEGGLQSLSVREVVYVVDFSCLEENSVNRCEGYTYQDGSLSFSPQQCFERHEVGEVFSSSREGESSLELTVPLTKLNLGLSGKGYLYVAIVTAEDLSGNEASFALQPYRDYECLSSTSSEK